jgi:hypothetical protein
MASRDHTGHASQGPATAGGIYGAAGFGPAQALMTVAAS